MSPDRFTTIRFVLRHRHSIAAVLTVLPLVAGAYAWLRSGLIDFALAGLILTPLAWLVSRVLLELLDVVAETLLPR